ncbi:MAG TPA: ribonuclease H [Brevefilum sp.]|nr:ribonuclease H [Brevefilum sp.]HPL69100.1 ribonuclease H [Brevefilum sp.]
MMKYNVTIHTDGICRGDSGNGGYAALMQCNGKSKSVSGGAKNTTNHRMELTAVAESLKALKTPCNVVVFSNSRLVVQGITMWMHKWAQQSWRRSSGDEPVHLDLWKQIYDYAETHKISAVWIKGCSGDDLLSFVNKIARAAVPS